MIYIYISIYLLGGIVHYVLHKKGQKVVNPRWTKQDRVFSLFTALTSWFGIIFIVIAYYEELFPNSNQEAKW